MLRNVLWNPLKPLQILWNLLKSLKTFKIILYCFEVWWTALESLKIPWNLLKFLYLVLKSCQNWCKSSKYFEIPKFFLNCISGFPNSSRIIESIKIWTKQMDWKINNRQIKQFKIFLEWSLFLKKVIK